MCASARSDSLQHRAKYRMVAGLKVEHKDWMKLPLLLLVRVLYKNRTNRKSIKRRQIRLEFFYTDILLERGEKMHHQWHRHWELDKRQKQQTRLSSNGESLIDIVWAPFIG